MYVFIGKTSHKKKKKKKKKKKIKEVPTPTFLLLRRQVANPGSDWAAGWKSSWAESLSARGSEVNSPLFTVAFAFVKCLRVNRA